LFSGLKNVEFDGYLKHFKPSQRYVEERQKLFAQSLLKRFPHASAMSPVATMTKPADFPDESVRQRK
jgi:hypothetical protein